MAAGTVLSYLYRHPSCCQLGLSTNSCQCWTQKRVKRNLFGIHSDATGPPASANQNCKDVIYITLQLHGRHGSHSLYSIRALWHIVFFMPEHKNLVLWHKDAASQPAAIKIALNTIKSGICHLHALIEVYPWYKYQLLLSACDDSSTRLAFKISSAIGPLNGNSCHFKEEKEKQQNLIKKINSLNFTVCARRQPSSNPYWGSINL